MDHFSTTSKSLHYHVSTTSLSLHYHFSTTPLSLQLSLHYHEKANTSWLLNLNSQNGFQMKVWCSHFLSANLNPITSNNNWLYFSFLKVWHLPEQKWTFQVENSMPWYRSPINHPKSQHEKLQPTVKGKPLRIVTQLRWNFYADYSVELTVGNRNTIDTTHQTN